MSIWDFILVGSALGLAYLLGRSQGFSAGFYQGQLFRKTNPPPPITRGLDELD